MIIKYDFGFAVTGQAECAQSLNPLSTFSDGLNGKRAAAELADEFMKLEIESMELF